MKKYSAKLRNLVNRKRVGLFESNIYRKDGRITTMELTISPVFNNNKVAAFELYERDISECRRIERKLINLCQDERYRIGRELHDGLGQILIGISLMLSAVARKLKMEKPVSFTEVTKIAKYLKDAIEFTQSIAMGLCPVPMETDGLLTALRELAHSVEKEYGIHCTLENSAELFPEDIIVINHLYYIALEAITNSIRLGKSKNIKILLMNQEKKFLLIILDDGKTNKTKKMGNKGMGLEIMKYRADIINALFNTEPQKKGFEVRIEIYL